MPSRKKAAARRPKPVTVQMQLRLDADVASLIDDLAAATDQRRSVIVNHFIRYASRNGGYHAVKRIFE